MDVPTLPDRLQRLVLLYLAVAYGTDRVLDPHERATAAALLDRWSPGLTSEAALAVVDTAHTAARAGLADDIEALARAVGQDLAPALRRRVLADLGQVARSDGHLSVDEASAIARVRAALRAG